MTPLDNVASLNPPPSFTSEAPLALPKIRPSSTKDTRPKVLSDLPYRRSNASLSSLFASTSTPPSSRPISPSGGSPPAGVLTSSVFSPGTRAGLSPLPIAEGRADEVRNLILRSFVPHIAIRASTDVEDIARGKGFEGGFQEILRPFGEHIQGKVTVRDGIGASRTWDDFGVRFVGLGDGLEDPRVADQRNGDLKPSTGNGVTSLNSLTLKPAALFKGGDIFAIEEVVEKHLSYAETLSNSYVDDYVNYKDPKKPRSNSASPFYTLYLRRLLSGLPLVPHETFSHPIACIIAISSRNPSPIEALRRLYSGTTQGEGPLPAWVNNEYLRYYVLVHDEDRDDIAKSTALFDQMKRHFGLDCHLLRLRTSQCVPTDDDSTRLPTCEWISAAEELAEIQKRERDDEVEDRGPYLLDSDSTSIRTFIREMVVQSIVPFMERCVSSWNDQVASRRRGVSGRLMSLSKRWTGFGSSSRGSSGQGPLGAATGANSNYDSIQGFYRPDTPEATMRKLADYAFMLRDWKLAQSTYELLRTDYNNDKAWKYHAAANEMAAISTLLNPQLMNSKMRSETIDRMLDNAAYSYITRCAAPYCALRCLALGIELLKVRGSSSADDAARWATRVLELRVVGPIGHALFTERVAACFGSKRGVGTGGWGARRRKSALWNVLAAEGWIKLERNLQAEKCLAEADSLHEQLPHGGGQLPFHAMNAFVQDLRHTLSPKNAPDGSTDGAGGSNDDASTLVEIEEESEKLDHRNHRKSLIGAGAAPFGSFDTAPLSPVRTRFEEPSFRDDSFE
ncbi:MAG: hypothetical protein M1812_000843 [Candelaria pacifica]|nr:MAG: hypothetical protein M1812_000843 [Candelaria pacifica]